MPRGIYDRTKMARPNRNGKRLATPESAAAPVVDTPPPTYEWLDIREVYKADIPSDDPWWPLYADLLRRLEQTPTTYALRVHFPSADGAASATTALHRLFAERLGDNAVSISRYACEPDYLYVQRGAHYAYNDSKRRRGAKLPGEEDQEF